MEILPVDAALLMQQGSYLISLFFFNKGSNFFASTSIAMLYIPFLISFGSIDLNFMLVTSNQIVIS